MTSSNEIESMWDNLLSREKGQIRRAFAALPIAEQEAILAHLRRMVEEPDWHPEQRISAQAALDALDSGAD